MNSPNGRFTILKWKSSRRLVLRISRFAAAVLLLALPWLMAQTVGTGSIVGIVTDPQGKPLAGAKVEITSNAKAAVIHETTSSAGLYSSGPIQPGDYVVAIEVKGFELTHISLAVHVGNTTRADAMVRLGTEKPRVVVPEPRSSTLNNPACRA